MQREAGSPPPTGIDPAPHRQPTTTTPNRTLQANSTPPPGLSLYCVALFQVFAVGMRRIRKQLAQADRLTHPYQSGRRCLDAAAVELHLHASRRNPRTFRVVPDGPETTVTTRSSAESSTALTPTRPTRSLPGHFYRDSLRQARTRQPPRRCLLPDLRPCSPRITNGWRVTRIDPRSRPPLSPGTRWKPHGRPRRVDRSPAW